jgi:VanZ family protein
LRLLVVLLYCSNLFILTCIESLSGLFEEGTISFQWVPNPEYMTFFDFHSYSFNEPSYIFQKVGHGAAFFILAAVVYWAVRNVAAAFITSVTFAFSTEIMQLHFSRTGCLLDVGYDTVGILCGLLVCIINRMAVSVEKNEM